MGPENFRWGQDELIFCVLIGFKAIRNEAPLFEVYLPDYAACYDKVLQPGLFKTNKPCFEDIDMNDVAWWDCLSDECEIYQKSIRMHVEAEFPTGRKAQGDYLWTIDWTRDPNMQGQWNVWNEHMGWTHSHHVKVSKSRSSCNHHTYKTLDKHDACQQDSCVQMTTTTKSGNILPNLRLHSLVSLLLLNVGID